MLREFLAVAARAAVQWVLASLLLANGAAFCLVAAVSERLSLGPPCVLCARVHRLLGSAGAVGDGREALRLLLCDAHLAAVVLTGPEEQACGVRDRSGKESVEGLDVDERDKGSGLESRRVVSIGSEICEQDHEDTNGSDAGQADHTTNDDDSPFVSLSPIIPHPRKKNDSERSHSLHEALPPPELLHNVDAGERLTVGQLLSLRAQWRELDALRAELEEERHARAEAEERRRQVEEQGELDREAARLAMELVHEAEREKLSLQQQLDACRAYQAQLCGGDGHHAFGEGERSGGEEDNNYQSLVDFLPGSVYSSTPDLVNLLKLYDEPTGNGDRRQREGYTPAVTVVAEEVEEEEIASPVNVEESIVHVDAGAANAGVSSHEMNTSCEVVIKAATGTEMHK